LPLLHDDALAWAECSTLEELVVGDHVLLVALVEAGGVRPELEPPLMYYRRSWGVWSPAHEDTEPEPVRIREREVSGRDLLWRGAEF
jgi:flavin reductase (DIM6/NTAB) family NADH-FMN oxidoreductase RutF